MAKRNLKLEYDSLLDAMKEAYRDCDEQKKSLLESIKKASNELNPEDYTDELELVKVLNDSRKILNDVIEKKIKLIQIHTKIVTGVKDKEINKEEVHKQPTLTQEEIKMIREDWRKEIDNNTTYDLT